MALVYNEATGNFDDIQAPPIIRYFRILESLPFYQDDKITITWQIDGANHIFLNGEEQFGTSKEIVLDVIGQQRIYIKATNSDGIAERDIILEVIPSPKFEVYPSATVLHKGTNENVIFRWNIENARDVKLLNGVESFQIPHSGEATFIPLEDTQFTFEAKGVDGTRVFRHTIPIRIREAAQANFKVNRQFSYPNLPIVLSWNIVNGTNVTIDDFGEQPLNGKLEVSPGVDTTYKLRYYDAFGENQRSISVRMLPLPVIKHIFVPAPKIHERFDISYITPQFKYRVPVPTFNSALIKLAIPSIPSLKNSFFVNPIISGKKKRIKNQFKSLYSYFFGKK